MDHEHWVPLRDAAERLGVRPERAWALARAGHLDAERIAGRWFVEPSSIERRLAEHHPAGRSWTPQKAWALLFLLSGDEAAAWPYLAALHPSDRSRLRAAVRSLSIRQLAPRLRRRARVLRLRAHPSDVARIAEEPGLVLTGVSAADAHGFDISAHGVLEGYVAADAAAALVERYALDKSAHPNVVLHAVEGRWPFDPGARVAPPLVAALDLLDGDDERTRRAGREYLSATSRDPR